MVDVHYIFQNFVSLLAVFIVLIIVSVLVGVLIVAKISVDIVQIFC